VDISVILYNDSQKQAYKQGFQIGFLAFSWRFYTLKLYARKLHTILFLNHFPLKKYFLVSYIWQYFCRQVSGQKGANRKPGIWMNTVDTSGESPERRSPAGTFAAVCLGPPKFLDVI
jgi:hypothetical protein